MKYNLFKAGIIPDGINKKKVKYDKKSGLRYLTKKMFKELSDEDDKRKVAGYTHLKQVDEDDKCDKLMVESGDEVNYLKYKPLKSYEHLKIWHHVKGYTVLDDDDFVAVVRFRFLFLLLPLLLFLLIFLIIFTLWIRRPTDDKPGLKFETEHAIEEPEERSAYTETIDVPGYSRVILNSSKKEMQLVNPEGNSVYFMYTLTEGDEEIHKTDAILPGNSVMVDLWSKLDAGDHQVLLSISTFDIETEEACNGTSQRVTVVVEK